MIEDQSLVADYQVKCRQYSVSLSCFQVFLGLKEDLVKKVGDTRLRGLLRDIVRPRCQLRGRTSR